MSEQKPIYPRWELIFELTGKIDKIFQDKSKELIQKKEHEITLDEVELVCRELCKISGEYITKHYVKEELFRQGILDIPSPQMGEKPKSNYIA